MPAVGPIYLLWRGSPWQRTVAAFILAYLAIILGCGIKNLHYLGPLLPLTVTLWLTARFKDHAGAAMHGPRLTPLLATIGLALSIWLCWPPQRPTFTLNRDLGQQTVFRTGDYEEACRWARIRTPLYNRGYLGWKISQHTGPDMRPATLRAEVVRPLCVTDGGSPAAGYELVFEYTRDVAKAIAAGEAVDTSPIVRLYCRDPQLRKRLAEERPLTGPQRFPRVFQPVAPQPEPQGPDR